MYVRVTHMYVRIMYCGDKDFFNYIMYVLCTTEIYLFSSVCKHYVCLYVFMHVSRYDGVKTEMSEWSAW